jgi:hypothetical protein
MVFSFPDRGVTPSLVSRNPIGRLMQTVLPHAHGEVDSSRTTIANGWLKEACIKGF